MAEIELPVPEPKPIDEQNWLRLRDLAERAVLRGHPYQNSERCRNCLYYLKDDDGLSYCWTPSYGYSSARTGGSREAIPAG